MNAFLRQRRYLLFGILFLGFLLRAFQFPGNPPGLYFDEATAGYDAFSLLRTGADRWGLPFPVYFVDWGNGQNVLYSYLSIPFLSLFGLSQFSLRLLSLFLGILALPLMYATVKRRLGEEAALVATAVLAILPWHILASHWALDSNILPFFLLLGIYTMTRALSRGASRGWIAFALMPWGLALYAYVMSFIVLPILLALILLFYWKTILENWKAWLMGAALFAIPAFGIALFLIKNFIVHDAMGIERFLPIGLPLLLTTRLQYVVSPIPGRWIDNFFFLLSGFQQGDYHDTLVGHAPLFFMFVPLSLIGAAYWVREFRSTRRPELFLLWLIACLPIFVVVDANAHRYNSIIFPMLVTSAYGLVKLAQAMRTMPRSRKIFVIGVSALLGLQAILFAYDFFWVFPSVPEYESAYAKNFDRAISRGLAIAQPAEPILLQPNLEFSFIFTLFYTSYPPEKFQREVKYTLQYSEYWVLSFGRFYVGVDNLPDPQGSFVYILGKWDPYPCAEPKLVWETRLWKVGRCN